MFASAALTLALYSLFVVVEVHTYPMQVWVEDTVGMNADTDQFYFGALPPGDKSWSGRKATYYNYNDFEVELSAFFSGEMKEWTYLENNNQRVPAGQAVDLYYRVQLNDNVEYGNYTGTAKLYVKRVFS